MKKLFALALAAVMTLSLAACGSSNEGEGDSNSNAATTVSITHDHGTVEVPLNPEKVATFDLGVLDILLASDINVTAFPPKTAPDYLTDMVEGDIVSIGSMKEVDYEALNEYAPDVIFVSGRLQSEYEELAKVAPTVYLETPGEDYMNTFAANVETLSKIFTDKTDAMSTRLSAIQDAAKVLAAKAAGIDNTALLIMANDGSISFFGEDSRYGVLYKDFGFTPASFDIENSTHGAEGTFEYVAEVNPDYIFVIDRSAAIGTEGATGAETLLDNDLVNGTSAAQNSRIIYLSSDIWYLVSGGFIATEDMIAEVDAGIK